MCYNKVGLNGGKLGPKLQKCHEVMKLMWIGDGDKECLETRSGEGSEDKEEEEYKTKSKKVAETKSKSCHCCGNCLDMGKFI